MRTTFSRTFSTATVVLLLALLSIGIFLRAMLEDYMVDIAFESLEKDASAIAELAAAYEAQGAMTDVEFSIDLDIAGDLSDFDAVVCDQEGRIVLCSDDPMCTQHQDLMVSQDYLQKVVSTGLIRGTGQIQGLYQDARYVCSVPIHSDAGEVVGIVMVSQPVARTQSFLTKATQIYIALAIPVIIICVVVLGLFAKWQMEPLRQVAKTARAFGHGDLEARVEVQPDAPAEVAELALAFNNMASSLQKSEYQRQEFVANVSHELKTPMTTIGGYIDGILDGTIPPDRARHYMTIVSDEIKRLSRLVRSMLDISQLQSQGGIPEEKKLCFDAEEAAGQVLITFEQKIEQKGLVVEVDMPEHPVYIFANQDYVTQVIYNLVDNAVKFCPQGGHLGLSIREGGTKALISVSNDGDTIPPEELPLVFDRFHKLDKSRSQNRDGWGLGLYIVRTIVCSHGENISVTSRDGKTTFTFTMPLVN